MIIKHLFIIDNINNLITYRFKVNISNFYPTNIITSITYIQTII